MLTVSALDRPGQSTMEKLQPSSAGQPMRLEIDLPDKYLMDESPEKMRRRLRLSTALLLFQEGRLSAGAACEFADIDRYAFAQACRQFSIPLVSYGPDDLDEELRSLRGDR